jgi:hypothetical protein
MKIKESKNFRRKFRFVATLQSEKVKEKVERKNS